MSLIFSDPTNKTGIVELIDDNVGSNSTTYPIGKKTRDINLALDNLMLLAIKACGKWQVDDTNHDDYPILTTDLIAGQRDYPFLQDEEGNLILDVYRVMVATPNGVFYDITPVDQQTRPLASNDPFSFVNTMVDGRELQGIPFKYDKTGNGIFLDLIPSYSYPKGLKLFVSRESSYFTISDTTKKPGIPGILHEYLAIRPAYYFAARKGLKVAAILREELIKFEGDERLGITGKIAEYFGQREKDTRTIMTPRITKSR